MDEQEILDMVEPTLKAMYLILEKIDWKRLAASYAAAVDALVAAGFSRQEAITVVMQSSKLGKS